MCHLPPETYYQKRDFTYVHTMEDDRGDHDRRHRHKSRSCTRSRRSKRRRRHHTSSCESDDHTPKEVRIQRKKIRRDRSARHSSSTKGGRTPTEEPPRRVDLSDHSIIGNQASTVFTFIVFFFSCIFFFSSFLLLAFLLN